MHDGVEHRRARLEIGMRDGAPRQQHEVGSPARREHPRRSPNGVVAAPCSVAMRKIWAQVGTSSPIPGTRWSRSAEAHLLEHVAVVVDAGLVEADRRPACRAARSGSRARCRCGGGDSSWDWADHGAAARDPVDVLARSATRRARASGPDPAGPAGPGAPPPCLRCAGARTRAGRRSRRGACASRPGVGPSSLRAPSGPHRSTSAGWRARAGCALARRGSGRAPPRGSGTGRADRPPGSPVRRGRRRRRGRAPAGASGRTPGRPRRRAGSGPGACTSTRPASRCPGRPGGCGRRPRRTRDAGAPRQPWMCWTVVIPDSSISNAE